MGMEVCIHKTIEGYSNIILTDMGSLVLQFFPNTELIKSL